MIGTPAGVNGVSASAIAGAQHGGRDRAGGSRSCGTSSARNKAGKAASSPQRDGVADHVAERHPQHRAADPRRVEREAGPEQHARIEASLALGGDRPGLVDRELGVQEP